MCRAKWTLSYLCHSSLELLLPLLLLFALCSSAEVTLPDCPNISPFTLSPALRHAMASNSGSHTLNVTCQMRSGTSATLLLGASDIRLESPFRRPSRSLSPTPVPNREANDAPTSGIGWNQIISHIPFLWRRLRAYPWGDPASVERFFFQRQLQLSFDIHTNTLRRQTNQSTGPTYDMPRSGLFSAAAFDRMRVTSFSPIPLPSPEPEMGTSSIPVELVCDYSAVLSVLRANGGEGKGTEVAKAVLRTISSVFVRRSHSPSAASAGSGVFLVEELGPYRASDLWLPSWMALWFGRRPLATSEFLLQHTDGRNAFVLEAQLPAVTPVCVRLAAADDSTLTVHLNESVVFDAFWLRIILLLCLVRFVRPWVEDHPALQVFVAGLGSVVVLLLFLALFVLRRLQDMTIGKMGLLALLAIGGLSALAESTMSATAALFRVYISHNEDLFQHTILGFLLVGVSCGLFARFFWSAYLAALTRWTLRWLQGVILTSAALQNREATIVFVCVALLLHPARVGRFILWCSRADGLENRENEPREAFPRSARREVRYAAPLCVEGRLGSAHGLNAEERLRLYEMSGNAYTQQALAQLAAKVQKNPNGYAARLSDPRGFKQWAKNFN